jgi:hypothetical protein
VITRTMGVHAVLINPVQISPTKRRWKSLRLAKRQTARTSCGGVVRGFCFVWHRGIDLGFSLQYINSAGENPAPFILSVCGVAR